MSNAWVWVWWERLQAKADFGSHLYQNTCDIVASLHLNFEFLQSWKYIIKHCQPGSLELSLFSMLWVQPYQKKGANTKETYYSFWKLMKIISVKDMQSSYNLWDIFTHFLNLLKITLIVAFWFLVWWTLPPKLSFSEYGCLVLKGIRKEKSVEIFFCWNGSQKNVFCNRTIIRYLQKYTIEDGHLLWWAL